MADSILWKELVPGVGDLKNVCNSCDILNIEAHVSLKFGEKGEICKQYALINSNIERLLHLLALNETFAFHK